MGLVHKSESCVECRPCAGAPNRLSRALAGLSGWKSPDRPVCGARAWLGFCQVCMSCFFFCELHGCFDEVVVVVEGQGKEG